MKPLDKMNATEKAELLYELLPDQILPFVIFCKRLACEFIENEGIVNDTLSRPILTPEIWLAFAHAMNETLTGRFVAVTSKEHFSQALFNEEIFLFTEYCIESYVTGNKAESTNFALAAYLFFI